MAGGVHWERPAAVEALAPVAEALGGSALAAQAVARAVEDSLVTAARAQGGWTGLGLILMGFNGFSMVFHGFSGVFPSF